LAGVAYVWYSTDLQSGNRKIIIKYLANSPPAMGLPHSATVTACRHPVAVAQDTSSYAD
jgi:hypothetical protein